MKKLGVHSGLNQVSPASYGGWPGYLNACWGDATAMAATMALGGFETRGFFDGECTRERIRQELGDAAAALESGDTFMFSNSGHGGQAESWSGKSESLCLFDGLLPDSQLRALISEFKAGVNVILCFDTCHSGGLDRDVNSRKRVAPLWVTQPLARTEIRGDIPLAANVILLAACRADETALDGDMNGAFTGALLKSRKGSISWREWMDSTSRYMSQHFPAQHPELIEISGNLADALV